ncbi:MAG TPA: hypothetical protein DCX03_11095 [Bacteroidales bacterium]|nr:hypothetical protein [Bacteroidales bacterium]
MVWTLLNLGLAGGDIQKLQNNLLAQRNKRCIDMAKFERGTSMDEREVLFKEYNNLWNEKLLHKQSIRKFHNYLTYISAIGSLALTFNGISASQVFNGIDPVVLRNAVNLFLIAFTPVVLLTLTFPLNDIFHIYVMGHQIADLEKRINDKSGGQTLLSWEHKICPVVYGGKKVQVGHEDIKLRNIISMGDLFLLVPFLTALCIVSTILSCLYVSDKLINTFGCGVGCLAIIGYLVLIFYMVVVLVVSGSKLLAYTKADGPIAKVVSNRDDFEGKTVD